MLQISDGNRKRDKVLLAVLSQVLIEQLVADVVHFAIAEIA